MGGIYDTIIDVDYWYPLHSPIYRSNISYNPLPSLPHDWYDKDPKNDMKSWTLA